MLACARTTRRSRAADPPTQRHPMQPSIRDPDPASRGAAGRPRWTASPTPHIRAGSGTRLRSVDAQLRYNARVALRDDPTTHPVLTALLDPERGYTALGDRLRRAQAPGPGLAGPHARCGDLDGAASHWVGAREVPLTRDALQAFLSGRAGAPPHLAAVLADGLATAVGTEIGSFRTGGAPFAQLVRAMTVLVCPDLLACPCRDRVVAALGAPGMILVMEDMDLRAS